MLHQTSLHIPVKKVQTSRLSGVDLSNVPFGKVFTDHMFVADYVNGEWTNLSVEPFQNLQLSPATSALHYGQAIFEGLKAYRSTSSDKILIFRPIDNWKRMNASAQRICMPELPEEVFMQGLFKLIDTDRNWVPNKAGSSMYIRPFMFATDEYVGVKPSATYKFIIFCCPVGSYYNEPVRVKVETTYSRAFVGGTGAAKVAGNYAASMYPARLAQEKGYHQLIWTDAAEHKYIEESGTMNVMFVINNTIVTSPITNTILDGITRKSVLHLAKTLGLKVEERKVSVAEIIEAHKNGTLKDAFGTGTAATIAPIATINFEGVDYTLPDPEKREVSKLILKTLTDIRLGLVPDVNGWVVTV